MSIAANFLWIIGDLHDCQSTVGRLHDEVDFIYSKALFVLYATLFSANREEQTAVSLAPVDQGSRSYFVSTFQKDLYVHREEVMMSRRAEMHTTSIGSSNSDDVVTLTARDNGFQGFEEITCKKGKHFTTFL